jgi:serine/threonine-protein kinase
LHGHGNLTRAAARRRALGREPRAARDVLGHAATMTAQWFGDYEIVQQLRVGGMATLYLARRHGVAGFARLVALKTIHPHLADQAGFLEMFVDEARICSQISHPHVVHVEGFGELDGVHYLVMEYVDGCSVNDLLVTHQRAGRRIDPELAARLIMQVAGGLHAAHEARGADGQPLEVIHRDISPSNILVSIDGHAKLIDFGIAKARNRVTETAAGVSLKGKLGYVAPEQANGGRVDRRCDVFSLGVVFWEMLVGQPLFPGGGPAELTQRLARTDVAVPSALSPAVPAALDRLVLAMLQHDPVERPQTAAEVERRIALAVPGAANRDASELAALAVEARDRRAARRREPTANNRPSGAIPRVLRGEGSGPVPREGSGPVPREGSGPVRVREGSGPVRVREGSGPVRVREGSGPVRVREGSGPVRVREGSGPETRDGSGSVRDGNGSVRDGSGSVRDGSGSVRDGNGSIRAPDADRDDRTPVPATRTHWFGRRVSIAVAAMLCLGVGIGTRLGRHDPPPPARAAALPIEPLDPIPPLPSVRAPAPSVPAAPPAPSVPAAPAASVVIVAPAAAELARPAPARAPIRAPVAPRRDPPRPAKPHPAPPEVAPAPPAVRPTVQFDDVGSEHAMPVQPTRAPQPNASFDN